MFTQKNVLDFFNTRGNEWTSATDIQKAFGVEHYNDVSAPIAALVRSNKLVKRVSDPKRHFMEYRITTPSDKIHKIMTDLENLIRTVPNHKIEIETIIESLESLESDLIDEELKEIEEFE